jgi:hypothetical protein
LSLTRRKTPTQKKSSGHVGVSFNRSRKKWVATIGFGGKTFYLGNFDKKEDAIRERKKAEEEFNAQRAQEIIGQKFGRLTILEKTGDKGPNGAYLYRCKCDCGNTACVSLSNLRGERIKSCGCLRLKK